MKFPLHASRIARRSSYVEVVVVDESFAEDRVQWRRSGGCGARYSIAVFSEARHSFFAALTLLLCIIFGSMVAFFRAQEFL